MHLNLNVHQVYAYLSNNLNKKRTGDLGIDKIYRRIETMIDDQKKEWDAVIKSRRPLSLQSVHALVHS